MHSSGRTAKAYFTMTMEQSSTRVSGVMGNIMDTGSCIIEMVTINTWGILKTVATAGLGKNLITVEVFSAKRNGKRTKLNVWCTLKSSTKPGKFFVPKKIVMTF